MNPCIYGQLIYDKGGKNISKQWGRDSLFSKLCWENWTATGKRIKLYQYLIPQTKINSKCIKDLNIRPETIKLLEENIGSRLLDIGLGDNFLNLTPKTKATKAKINKWNCMKLKSFCIAKTKQN